MTQYTWLLWDALAVLVLIWAVEKAARKGFVRAVLELLSCVVAAMLSQYCAPLLAPRLYEWFGRDLARMAVEKQIESSGLLDGVGGLAQSVTGMLGGFCAMAAVCRRISLSHPQPGRRRSCWWIRCLQSL